MNPLPDKPRTQEEINEAIARARDELTHMIDLNPQVMLLVDPSNTVLRANKALVELLGLAHYNDALQRPLAELFPCEDTEFFDRLMLDQPLGEDHEAEVTFPDGSRRLLRFRLVGAGRHAEQFAIIVYDAADEKRAEERTEKEHKMAAVEALVGGLMHNMNQPLTVMLVRAQLLHLAMEKGTVEPDEIKKGLQDIMRMTLQVSEMIKNVADAKDFVTEDYVGNVQIMDIYGSSAAEAELISSHTSIVQPLLVALDAHDPGGSGHSQRTAKYARFLARKLGMTNKDVAFAQRAAFLHDIGKLGIPDSILQKPGELTPEEMETMHRHSELGYNILRSFPSMVLEADVAYAHHEHIDGSGYPRGLSGDDITQTTRLVAVADSFDAMCSVRPYHDAMEPDEAAAKIISGAGTLFDADIVNVFKAGYREMIEGRN